MKCRTCGAEMRPVTTDLPFKRGDRCIVVIRDLPVYQCGRCVEYLLEDSVMAWVEAALDKVDSTAELEIVRYAA